MSKRATTIGAGGGTEGDHDKEKKTDDELGLEEKIAVEDVDIFNIEDVCNIGNGEPLFARFKFEDWALLSLRLELHFLVHAFRRDVADPERIGIHEQHLPFYYNKYYRKAFNVTYYGVRSNLELIDFVKGSVSINKDTSVIEPQMP